MFSFFLSFASEAERIRKEFDDSSAKLSKLQSRISSLTQKLKQDFGKSAMKVVIGLSSLK